MLYFIGRSETRTKIKELTDLIENCLIDSKKDYEMLDLNVSIKEELLELL